MVQDIFCDFYFVKNHNIANNSTTTKALEKINTDLESSKFYNFFEDGLAKFENNQSYLIKLTIDVL
jgi:hypothetical protein